MESHLCSTIANNLHSGIGYFYVRLYTILSFTKLISSKAVEKFEREHLIERQVKVIKKDNISILNIMIDV